MVNVELVASDIDSTQLIPGNKLPTLGVQAAAASLRAADVYLLEASSRIYPQIAGLVGPLALEHNLCVLDNGATVQYADTGEILWSNHLEPESVDAAVAAIGDHCTRICFDDNLDGYTPQEAREGIASGRLLITKRPTVFSVFKTEEKENVVQALDAVDGITHSLVMGYHDIPELRCIQVMNPGISKHTGINHARRLAKLRGKLALGIGDGWNDLDLFAAIAEEDGIIVLMGNASDELKDITKQRWPNRKIVSSVQDDGWAEAMRKYVLRNRK